MQNLSVQLRFQSACIISLAEQSHKDPSALYCQQQISGSQIRLPANKGPLRPENNLYSSTRFLSNFENIPCMDEIQFPDELLTFNEISRLLNSVWQFNNPRFHKRTQWILLTLMVNSNDIWWWVLWEHNDARQAPTWLNLTSNLKLWGWATLSFSRQLFLSSIIQKSLFLNQHSVFLRVGCQVGV